MERRNLLQKIFGKKETNNTQVIQEVKLLDGTPAVFTEYNGKFYNDPDVLSCVDAIARNCAKMHPKHIRKTKKKVEYLKGNIYKKIANKPNEFQNAYQFYYQLVTMLFLNNDVYAYVKKDDDLNLEAIYILTVTETKLYQLGDKLFIKAQFGYSNSKYIPYDDCIHLTRFSSKNGLFGGTSEAITKVLSMKHVLDEGIINAIKTTASIKGALKSTKSLLKPEDVKKMRDDFVKNFLDDSEGAGIGGLDASTDFIPITLDPKTASDEQIKEIDDKVLSYFGLSQEILQSKYNEDQWNAFYESVLEPIGLQMGLEFTNKIFTPTALYFGNEIVFESNRLQYASNKTKIELIRYAGNILSINEQREIFNLAPIDNGDTYLIDQNHEVNDEIGGNEDEGKGN